MGVVVREILDWEIMKDAKLISGQSGLENEVKGATIIEAPDIVKFINGGEALLTSLYAFKDCSLEEMKTIISDLEEKRLSAVIFKRGKKVEFADEKIELFRTFSERCAVPMLEIPFALSFKDVISRILEQLFNTQVKQLKYFKTLHDNFEVLALSPGFGGDGIARILDVLGKTIGNPVGVFGSGMVCLGTTDTTLSDISEQDDIREFEPETKSNYVYRVQQISLETKKEKVNQYLMRLKYALGEKAYLAVTEQNEKLDDMDFIAIESAASALQYELSKRYEIVELEKKYQNDMMHNILNGKVRSAEEIRNSAALLNMDMDGLYRVIVLSAERGKAEEAGDMNRRMKNIGILKDAVRKYIPLVYVQNELERVIVVQEERQQKPDKIRAAVSSVQKYIAEYGKSMLVRAGVGKVVQGLSNLKISYREATDALVFMDMAGKPTTPVMMFSEMGALKLLCKVKSPEALLEYIPESLLKLYNYRKGQREDLILTLETYLDKNQNLAKTAQELFIHYKTAAYRMEKIANITGIDFSNAHEMLAVRIGMVAYNIYERFDKE